MAIFINLFVTLILLVFSILNGVFVGFPLLLSTLFFFFIAKGKGASKALLISAVKKGSQKALLLLRIFVLIGIITGVWRASGTVPSIVYYGIEYMQPQWFILYAFLMTALVSLLLGTSFGTVGTVGVAIILMARSGNVDLNLTAGAIMAGAYFGDRCSPMSSSANLVANLTDTNLYDNIKRMFKTGALPLILSIIGYGILSHFAPLSQSSEAMNQQIANTFSTHWISLIPALLILVFAAFKLDVKISMLISIVSAAAIAFFLQGYSLLEILKFSVVGFSLPSDNPLGAIMMGGGIWSMWKAIFIVFVSSVLANLFESTGLLHTLDATFAKAKGHFQLYTQMLVVGTLSCAIGCNQSIAVFLSEQLMRSPYEKNGISKSNLAIDIENTGIVIAALIPWNIAAFVPTATLGVSATAYLPYAFYLYLIPLLQWWMIYRKKDASV